jgi:hypothetical protein
MKTTIGILSALLFLLPLFSEGASTRCSDESPVKYELQRVINNQLKLNKIDSDQDLRDLLLLENDIYSLKTEHGREAFLVYEKGYLNASQRTRQEQDIADALEEVPKIVGRSFDDSGPITYFIYESKSNRPTSYSDKIGILPGKLGTMLILSDENADPTFHETAHLTEKVWAEDKVSESLSEGMAQYVQDQCRPGRAAGLTPENLNPDLFTKKYLSANTDSSDFLEKIGTRGNYDDSWPNQDARHAFYFSSWSFTKYLLAVGSMPDLLKALDAGGDLKTYQALHN